MGGKYTKGGALALVCILCVSLVCTASAEPSVLPHGNTTQIAGDVYIYGFPLVLMDITRGQLTAVPEPGLRQAPVNQFLHASGTPTPRFAMVVSPNVDTLYSSAFLDLAKEPVVLSVPDTGGRYYLMPVVDAWSNVIASPGSRTTGTGAGNFLITGPGWDGPVPAGMSRIRSPTTMVWLIGRTLVNTSDPADFAEARATQVRFTLTPLSAWGTTYTPPTSVPVDPAVDPVTAPADQVANMTPAQFYTRLGRLLANNPPPAADAAMVQEMAGLGMIPGTSFDGNSTDPETRDALAQGAADGFERIVTAAHASRSATASTNNWLIMNYSGSYGTRYLERAATAWTLAGANLPEDCVYSQVDADAEGLPLSGTNRYVIHFTAHGTPPVRGFWSITMYNNRQFLVNNPIGRYAVGDRTPLQYNADGTLDIFIQQDSPGRDRESNWLPAPPDGFNLFLRQYWPSEDILSRKWIPPAVVRVTQTPPAGAGTPAIPATTPARYPATASSPLPPELGAAGLLIALLFMTGRR